MGRAEHPVRTRRSIAAKSGPPPGRDPTEPGSLVLQAVAGNDKFRDDQVSHPAAAWVAAGAKGVPMTPEERMATTHIPGGVAQITPMLEPPIKQTSENRKRKREERKMRRQSAVQEPAHFRDSAKSRQAGGGGGGGGGFGGDQGRGPGKAGGKGTGKTRAHDVSGKELCLSWTNRVGDGDSLPPKAPCPKGRVHKCQVYPSPEHRASTRPQRPKV